MSGAGPSQAEPAYAMTLANGSFDWYRSHAIRARRFYKTGETLMLVLAASIPVSAVIWPEDALVPAVLGGLVVVLTGARTIFHWQENYLRFSGAREAVEPERRRYYTQTSPYDDASTRDSVLAARVTAIEHEEMAGWMKVAAQRPDVGGKSQG